MSLFNRIPIRLSSFVFEVIGDCNHACRHCYNAWRAPGRPAAAEPLGTAETLAMVDRMIAETGANLVTLTGGEPMLRADIHEIVDHLFAGGQSLNLISNGSLLDEPTIERLAGKISIFELPLLGADRALHDRVSGRTGAFDDVTAAIANCKAAGQMVVCVFVATRENLPAWTDMYELAFALGADGLMFNRFNPGGTGVKHVEQLQASPEELSAALDSAETLIDRYGLPVSCSIPMPPCLFDHTRWPHLSFGFCAAGTDRAYYTLDPVGNVRPCNHSETVLGNIRTQSFRSMARGRVMKTFKAARPALCAGCRLEATCQGGCKAAAEVCCGALDAPDPFLAAYQDQMQRVQSSRPRQGREPTAPPTN